MQYGIANKIMRCEVSDDISILPLAENLHSVLEMQVVSLYLFQTNMTNLYYILYLPFYYMILKILLTSCPERLRSAKN